MSTLMYNISNLMRKVEFDLLGPAINKEKFDILIKMAEGFHALAEKGYPGSSELLNEIFTRMGERFHTQFKEDDAELLELQGLFIQGFKNKDFYNKKLKQFTKRAVINLDLTGKNESNITRSVAADILKDPKNFNLKRVEEANQENASSRFDAIKQEFNAKISDQSFLDGLDSHGIGLVASIAISINSLELREHAKMALNVGKNVLKATEKNNLRVKKASLLNRIIMRILRFFVKKTVTDSMSESKKKIDQSIEAVKTRSTIFMSTKKQVSEKKAEKKTSFIDKFWQHLFPSEDQANKKPQNISDLLKMSREQMEDETFDVFKKSLETMHLLENKNLIHSKEWLSTMTKMEELHKTISDLESKIATSETTCAKFKTEKNDKDYLEEAKKLDVFKNQKTELFKDVLLQLKQFSSIPIPKGDAQLAELSSVVGFAVIKIDKFYHIETAVIEAYRLFSEKQQVYVSPFIDKKTAAKEDLSKFEALKVQFVAFLKQMGLNEALEANVSKASIDMQLKLLDNFSDKLKEELIEMPKNTALETRPLLESDVDMLDDLNQKIESIAKEIEKLKTQKKTEDQNLEAQPTWKKLLKKVANSVYQRAAALLGNPVALQSNPIRENELRINNLKEIRTAISNKKNEIALETTEYNKINRLHSLFMSLGDLNNKKIMEAEDQLKAKALEQEINNQINSIIKDLSWNDITTGSKINFENQLKFANAVLKHLELYPQYTDTAPKPENLQKPEKNLKEKVAFYELMKKNSEAFNFQEITNTLFNPSASNTGCSILERYRNEQKDSLQVIKNIQYSSRTEDIEFLEKVVLLMNDDDTMLDINKMSVFLGVLNYLDKALEANAFTSGVNNFKQMILKIREETYSTMQLRLNDVPQSYEMCHALEKGSEIALRQFIKKHEQEFKNIPQAKKMLPPKQTPLLYQKAHVEKKSKLQHRESTKKSKPRPRPNSTGQSSDPVS